MNTLKNDSLILRLFCVVRPLSSSLRLLSVLDLREKVSQLEEKYAGEAGAREDSSGGPQSQQRCRERYAGRLCAANKVIDHQKEMAESPKTIVPQLAKRIAELGKERSLPEKKKISELALKLDIASMNLAREHQSLEKREQNSGVQRKAHTLA